MGWHALKDEGGTLAALGSVLSARSCGFGPACFGALGGQVGDIRSTITLPPFSPPRQPWSS